MHSVNNVVKGFFYKARINFKAFDYKTGLQLKVPLGSHILVLRGGSRVNFLALFRNSDLPINAVLDRVLFEASCELCEAFTKLPDELLPYSLLKVERFKDGGFKCKLVEHNAVIGDVICSGFDKCKIPQITFDPIAKCSCLVLGKFMDENKDKYYTIKRFIYYLYLGYQGLLPFDFFCSLNKDI